AARGRAGERADPPASVPPPLAPLAAGGRTLPTPRFPPRPRLRAARGQARGLRPRDRAPQGVVAPATPSPACPQDMAARAVARRPLRTEHPCHACRTADWLADRHHG